MRQFIFGTDWWTDCDDCVAARLVARAAKANQIKLLGVGINATMEYSVASMKGFLKSEGVENIPIGIDLEATDYGGNPPYQKRLKETYCPDVTNADAMDGVRLYRKILAEAVGKVEIMEIGFMQILGNLLQSEPDDLSDLGGLALVREKVEKIWIMAGRWDGIERAENNFARNERTRIASEAICRICPVPITFLGWEIGVDVITGDNLEPDDTLHLALKDFGTTTGRHSWDPMLALLALIGDEEKAGYRTVRGFASVDPKDGKNSFRPDPNGLHRYIIKTKDNDYYKNAINDLIR